MPTDSAVRARIDTATKERAAAALEAMGRVPNGATRRAMAELEQGKGRRFDSPDALFEDLDI